MKQMESDIVIIGGGCSGLAAALSAAEAGCKVILLEKLDHVGGTSMGGNGMFAVETRYQRSRQIIFTREDAINFFLNHTHYKVDARLIKAYVDKSAGTIDWLERIGIKFIEPVAYFPGGKYTWHYKDPGCPPITDVLSDKAAKLGCRIFTGTPAKEIVKKDGVIRGVIAETKSGESVHINAGIVIIGTGGFGDNLDWIKKYTGHDWGKTLFSARISGLTGDGIRMAWDAGAAETEMYMDTFRGLPEPYHGPGGPSVELGTFRQPGLMVDLNGERFVNEEIVFNGSFAGNAVHIQKDGCAFAIIDEDINRYYEENDWDWMLSQIPQTRSKDMPAIIRKAQSEGYKYLFMADSIEELCSRTGIDLTGLKKTLAEYNHACETGRDELFYKKAAFLKPVKRPKFYAAKFTLSGYGTLGGIRINQKAEVLDKAHEIIKGLYAAGTDANVLCGDSYIFAMAGHTSSFAYNTGRIAGENAALFLKNK